MGETCSSSVGVLECKMKKWWIDSLINKKKLKRGILKHADGNRWIEKDGNLIDLMYCIRRTLTEVPIR